MSMCQFDFPLQILLLHCLYRNVTTNSCFQQCKDQDTKEMEEALKLPNKQMFRLMTPLNMLLGKYGESTSLDDISTKLTAVCRTNAKFLRCVQQCPDQMAIKILVKGQTAWMTICKTYNLYPDSFKYSVLGCWSRYGNKISLSCAAEEAKLESSFLKMAINGKINVYNYTSSICSNVIDHDICYLQQVGQFCDRIALRFVLQLNERSFMAMSDLFQWSAKGNVLPNECKLWLKPTQLQLLLGDRSIAHRRALSAGAKALFITPLIIVLLCYLL